MIISLAQFKSISGDIRHNIERHKKFIELAHDHKSEVIVFPELSVTNYEPSLANNLAVQFDDESLNEFQDLSNSKAMTICTGMPIKDGTNLNIGLLIFEPHKPRQVYLKKYLHADEEPFFMPYIGDHAPSVRNKEISLAICYEVFIPAHAETAHQTGATIYIASVAKTASGVERAFTRMSEIASQYCMTTLMANSVGEFDGCSSGGRSAVWTNNGEVLGQLDSESEGLVVYDSQKDFSKEIYL